MILCWAHGLATREIWRLPCRLEALQERPPVWPNTKGLVMPTQGWSTLFLALSLCRRVNLYGFSSPVPHGEMNHYFDRVRAAMQGITDSLPGWEALQVSR